MDIALPLPHQADSPHSQRGRQHWSPELIALIWSSLALIALLGASVLSWLKVPLIIRYSSWSLPVDVGWGVRSPHFSYGLLCFLIALLVLLRILSAVGWSRVRPEHRRPWLRPLRARSLILMGWVATSITLLFLFQFVFVDFKLVRDLADQETQLLLIRTYVGYPMATTLLPITAFGFSIASPLDRLLFVPQVIAPGMLMPLAAGLLCFYGCFLTRRAESDPDRRDTLMATGSRTWWGRKSIWVVVGLLIVLVGLGRAPLGLYYEYLGQKSLDGGHYQSALNDLARAVALTPSLDALAAFHIERGTALYQLGHVNDLDAGLYIAERDRAAKADTAAWWEDESLYRRYPNSTTLINDMAVTLEQLTQRDAGASLLPVDVETQAQKPQDALRAQLAARALPWLDALVRIQPDNVFARYLRGRILFAQHSFEPAASDFQAILALTHDREMLSNAYTYLAFCHTQLGDLVGGRALLLKAVSLDDGYYNNIAREAASGLH